MHYSLIFPIEKGRESSLLSVVQAKNKKNQIQNQEYALKGRDWSDLYSILNGGPGSYQNESRPRSFSFVFVALKRMGTFANEEELRLWSRSQEATREWGAADSDEAASGR